MKSIKGEFRFIYNSAKYDETVAFYRDDLQLPLLDSWDEGPEARGSVFQAVGGIIEVMEHPATQGSEWVVYPPDLPKGVSLAVEVDNVDEWYERARERKLPIKTELANFNWGQRGFAVFEPNGLVIFVYSIILNENAYTS
ncbi:MAG TPA: VOC family protein [Anaerolineales bacterium]